MALHKTKRDTAEIMVCIDIKALKAGLHEYDWDLKPEAIDLDPEVFSDLHVHAKMDLHPSRIFVTLEVDGVAKLVCDRTLVTFEQPIEGEYSILFAGAEFFEGMEGEQEEDMKLLSQDDEEIDLTEAVRDTFLLAIPQRRIAPGAEAEEIPMQFGRLDAVDPRWEALLALKTSDESETEKGEAG